MSNLFFTSDLHLGHRKYKELGDRDFVNIDVHDQYIISRINHTCGKGDILYVLGDISLHRTKEELVQLLKKIKPQLFVIKGNHDSERLLKYLVKNKAIINFYSSKVINVNSTPIHLSHYPLRLWHKKDEGGIHLYGHTHGRSKFYDKSMDVGIDAIGFEPISLNKVMETMELIENDKGSLYECITYVSKSALKPGDCVKLINQDGVTPAVKKINTDNYNIFRVIIQYESANEKI